LVRTAADNDFMRLFLFAVPGIILPGPDDRPKIEAAIAVFGYNVAGIRRGADIVSTIAEWLKSLGLSLTALSRTELT